LAAAKTSSAVVCSIPSHSLRELHSCRAGQASLA
jgi:hypothetical protein